MQSPFKILRRFQKVVLAFLAVMAMIAFGVGDQLLKMTRTDSAAGGQVVVESSAGNLTQQEFGQLVRKRQTANAFMYRAALTANPQFQLLESGLRFHFGGESPQEVFFGWLMQHEARRMGIVVDDKQIKAHIQTASRTIPIPGFEQFSSGARPLSADQFSKVLGEMHLGARELYDILREELQGQMAIQLLRPVSTHTPEQYWEYYRKLHTRQKIQVAALPLEEFAAGIEDPPESTLVRFFDAHKGQFDSSSGGEFRPGFRQPPKARLHYLQLTYLDIEQQVLKDSPVSDKDIEEYYEAKKGIDRRLQDFDTAPPTDDAEKSPIDPEFVPEGERRPEPPDLPTNDPEGGSAPDGQCGEPGEEAVAAKEEEEKPGDAATPADDATSEKPASPSEEDAKATTDQAVGGEKRPEGEGAPKKPDIRPIKFKPLDDDLRTIIRESIVHERTLARMKQVAGSAAEELRDAGLRLMQQNPIDPNRPAPDQLNRLIERSREEMRAIAEKYGLKFTETGLVSARELGELPGIGKGLEPDSDASAPGGARTVIDMAFSGEGLCQVMVAESSTPAASTSRDTYIFWKVQHVASHVPTFDEPGVKEEVLKAWKLQQALPEARKRAEQLAELVRKGKDSMTSVLAGQTTTGAAKALALTVRESPEFSWWRESLAPDTSMRGNIQLSNPIVVTDPGPVFMQYVFEELQEGDVGVALNDDASICYVVKVLSRRPADREAFKTAPVFSLGSPYASLGQMDQQTTLEAFGRHINQAYAVNWRNLGEADMAPMDDEQ